MSHSFHAQKRKEKFYKLAKEQGFRSRAAYKLIQLNKKYNFLGGAKACIDLCAAPGGWLQIASKYMPVQSMIIGVDILPIKPLPNVVTFVEDITTQSCRSALRKQLQGWQVDLVLHDGAPNVGGGASWSKDAYQQIELVLHSVKLASEFLVEGGTFVTKIFRSNDYLSLIWILKQFFKKVEVTKPIASRQESSEIFAICLGYLAPKTIDPKLFDPQTVFKATQLAEDKMVKEGRSSKKENKVNKSGYDTESQILFTRKTVAEFVEATDPHQILNTVNQLYFDEASAIYKTHAATTPGIIASIEDIKLLSKNEHERVLKWHKKLRQYKHELDEALKKSTMVEEDPEEIIVDEQTEEQKRLQALEDLSSILKTRAIKMKKKKHELRMRELRRLAMNANDLVSETNNDEIFNIRTLRTDEDINELIEAVGDQKDSFIDSLGLKAFTTLLTNQVEELYEDDEESMEDEHEFSDMSDDEKFKMQRQKQLDYSYEEYKKKKGIVNKKDRRPLGLKEETVAKIQDIENLSDAGSDGDEETSDDELPKDAISMAEETLASSRARSKLVTDSYTPDQAVAEQWFSQDVFTNISYDDGMTTTQLNAKKRTISQAQDEYSDSDSSDEEAIAAAKSRWLGDSSETSAKSGKGVSSAHTSEHVEEVKLSDYSDDTDARAEVLALGTKMLRKKARNELINNAYNRYAYNDHEELPSWFVDNENIFNRPCMPVTKQEVNAIREQLKAINARPIKKIAESSARKKKKAIRRLERMKIEANNIIEQEGVSAAEKMKQVEKLYRTTRAKQKMKPVKHYVVSSKSGDSKNAKSKVKGAGKPFIVRVDKRMKKDKRGAQRAAKKHKHKK